MPLSVLQVGGIPPPIGGNNVHVLRLMQRLQRDSHWVRVLNPYRLDLVGSGLNAIEGEGCAARVRRLVRLKERHGRLAAVHFHVAAFGRFRWAAEALFWLFRREPKVVTIHSGSFVRQNESPRGQRAVYDLLSQVDRVIAVNHAQRAFLLRTGLSPDRVRVIPAFIAGGADREAAPAAIRAAKAAGRKVVLTSGYLTRLYRHETLIECALNLPRDAYHFGFCFYDQIDPAYRQAIQAQLAPLENVSVFFDLQPDVFLGALAWADVYVRCTETDGDAVAIREALATGAEVYATSAVQRPEGCRLFAVGDATALLRLFERVGYHQTASTSDARDAYTEIVRLYRELAGRA